MTGSKSLDLDSQYCCLASVALSLGYSTSVPRDRVLTQASTSLLVRTFADRSFSKEEALSTILEWGFLPELRSDVANSIFSSLQSEGIVVRISDDDGGGEFSVSEQFISDCKSSSLRIEKTISRVVSKLFSDQISAPDSLEKITEDLINAISVVMERHGRQYAYQVSGKIGADSIVNRTELVLK